MSIIFGVILFFTLIYPAVAFVGVPFGGRVTAVGDGEINSCPGTNHPIGPLTVQAVGQTQIFSPIALPLTAIAYPNYTANVGDWILGMITPILVPDYSCVNNETGAPWPIFPLQIYGTSGTTDSSIMPSQPSSTNTNLLSV